MVFVQPSTASSEAVDVVIPFQYPTQDPIYISVDALDWQLQPMIGQGEAHEHVITVPKSTRTILYKFRVGEHHWVHDGTVTAEPDNFGGWNNRFEIPEVPHSSIPSEYEDDTEPESAAGLESVAEVESVADTVSEVTDAVSEAVYEDMIAGAFNDEPEFVDVEDRLSDSDPDFPAYMNTPQSASSLRQWLGFGVRKKGALEQMFACF